MASDECYKIRQGVPTPQQYYDLREAAGLTPPLFGDIAKGLAGTWAGFVAVDTTNNDNIVSMGRVLGDGSMFLEVVDIATHPDHRERGLASRIVQALVHHVDEHAPNAYLSLIGDQGAAQYLYPKFGFSDTKPSTGMYRCERIRVKKEAELRKWEETQQK